MVKNGIDSADKSDVKKCLLTENRLISSSIFPERAKLDSGSRAPAFMIVLR